MSKRLSRLARYYWAPQALCSEGAHVRLQVGALAERLSLPFIVASVRDGALNWLLSAFLKPCLPASPGPTWNSSPNDVSSAAPGRQKKSDWRDSAVWLRASQVPREKFTSLLLLIRDLSSVKREMLAGKKVIGVWKWFFNTNQICLPWCASLRVVSNDWLVQGWTLRFFFRWPN